MPPEPLHMMIFVLDQSRSLDFLTRQHHFWQSSVRSFTTGSPLLNSCRTSCVVLISHPSKDTPAIPRGPWAANEQRECAPLQFFPLLSHHSPQKSVAHLSEETDSPHYLAILFYTITRHRLRRHVLLLPAWHQGKYQYRCLFVS